METMAYSAPIPQLHSLGTLVHFFADPTDFLVSFSINRIAATGLGDENQKPLPPAEDFPIPDGEEINPNQEVPEEEDYLPNEQEMPVEEPPKEIEEDPYFPRKGDGLPPLKEGEFPETDPV